MCCQLRVTAHGLPVNRAIKLSLNKYGTCRMKFPLASCLIYLYALIEYINRFAVDRMVTLFFTMLPSVKFAEEKVLVFFILCEKC